MKKALSLFLATLMVVAAIPMAAISAVADTTTVQITDAADFLAYINGEKTTQSGYTYVLQQDIDLEGTNVTSKPFALNGAIFDGNGKTITGYTINSNTEGISDTYTSRGLFTVSGNVTIENLNIGIKEAPISIVYDGRYSSTSALVGVVPAGANLVFDQVSTWTNMSIASGGGAWDKYVGSFVAEVKGTLSLNKCFSNGTIEIQSNGGSHGGGGMIGKAQDGASVTLTNCTNNANLYAISNSKKHGGFVGSIGAASLSVTNCVNNGDIMLKDGKTGQLVLVGGVLGDIYLASNPAKAVSITVDGFTNNGKLVGHQAIGGVIGELQTSNSTQKGTVSLSNIIIDGKVESTNTGWGHAGGVISSIKSTDDVTVTNCEIYADVIGNSSAAVVAYVMKPANILGTKLSVTNTKIYGNIKANTDGNLGAAGGVVGLINSDNAYNLSIEVENAANYGDIRGGFAGGIAGRWSSTGTLSVTSFVNHGSLTATHGRAATILGTVSDTTTGAITIDGVVNTGAMNTNWSTIGGMIGYCDGTSEITVKNTVNTGTSNKTDNLPLVGIKREITAENNYYANYTITTDIKTPEDDTKTFYAQNAELIDTKAEWAQVLTDINAKYSALAGEMKLAKPEGDKNTLVKATPEFVGVQQGKVSDNLSSIRLVGIIGNTLEYNKVGFNVTFTDSTKTYTTVPYACKEVYTSLKAVNGENEMIAYTPEELGGTYIYALTIGKIDATVNYTIKVEAFAVEVDGSKTYTGDAYNIVIEKGVIKSVEIAK